MLRAIVLAFPIIATCFPVAAADLTVRVENSSGMPLAAAVVYATPTAQIPHAGPLKAIIDQVNRAFVPVDSVVQAGTSVSFPNSDNIRHSVYSFSPAKVFTLKLYAGTPSNPVVFDKPGVVVLGCNIHDSMVAWVLVVDSPYFVRTDSTGLATLTGLPAGDYQLRAWHAPMSEEIPGEALHVQAVAPATRVIRLDVSGRDDGMAMPK